jgi:cytochrome c553
MNIRYLAAGAAALLCVVAGAALLLRPKAASTEQATREPPPAWAYVLGTPAPREPEPPGTVHRAPGSPVAMTRAQVGDRFNIPDWRPDGHPAMPPAVKNGRDPDVMGCGYCHMPDGQGRPENAGVAGLPARYIIEQVKEIKAGRRRPAVDGMGPQDAMIKIAQLATPAEVAEAAGYFSKLEMRQHIRVVESETAPKTHLAGRGLLAADKDGAVEPLGQRIIEVPENEELAELRDANSGYVAYVPVGSIDRGETLVRRGGRGRTVACIQCHGPTLRGAGVVPPLAGRSPSYLVRQLYDMQAGTRHGPTVAPMRPVVAKLTVADMVDIAAYVSSREP